MHFTHKPALQFYGQKAPYNGQIYGRDPGTRALRTGQQPLHLRGGLSEPETGGLHAMYRDVVLGGVPRALVTDRSSHQEQQLRAEGQRGLCRFCGAYDTAVCDKGLQAKGQGHRGERGAHCLYQGVRPFAQQHLPQFGGFTDGFFRTSFDLRKIIIRDSSVGSGTGWHITCGRGRLFLNNNWILQVCQVYW